jgi:hypothetical protein
MYNVYTYNLYMHIVYMYKVYTDGVYTGTMYTSGVYMVEVYMVEVYTCLTLRARILQSAGENSKFLKPILQTLFCNSQRAAAYTCL